MAKDIFVHLAQLCRSMFVKHIGPREKEQQHMLKALGHNSMDSFIQQVLSIDRDVYNKTQSLLLNVPTRPQTESSLLIELRHRIRRFQEECPSSRTNSIVMPTPAIRRALLDNPTWYTAYTPYQAEISQGRLEGLIMFQTMVTRLTGLPVANSGVLDVGSAAAEGVGMLLREMGALKVKVEESVNPGIKAVIEARFVLDFGDSLNNIPVMLVINYSKLSYTCLDNSVRCMVVILDTWDTDTSTTLKQLATKLPVVAVGSTALIAKVGPFSPNAAFVACTRDLLRTIPGRLVGQSIDTHKHKPALRLALQTREQHIRRARATSNLCTAQTLPAIHTAMEEQYEKWTGGELEFDRKIRAMGAKDMTLVNGAIPLGSCTMKLTPAACLEAYRLIEDVMIYEGPATENELPPLLKSIWDELSSYLQGLTGLHGGCTFEPRSGAQAELAGLLAIRTWYKNRGDNRTLCLIPASAHGTNPASVTMAGLTPITLPDDPDKASELVKNLSTSVAVLMITFPSTYGSFNLNHVQKLCKQVHETGGLVYLDGANMNACMAWLDQDITVSNLLDIDLGHLNLHKTFAIPHGGGGPGVGALLFKNSKLARLVPPVSYPRWGNTSLLVIPWAYIRLLSIQGLAMASRQALLSANYLMYQMTRATELTAITGPSFHCAHEFVLDWRPLKEQTGITVEDVACRLQDYSWHAPTINWPIPGTLMFEPTESEPLSELDCLVDAMQSIAMEAKKCPEVINGAPHPLSFVFDTTFIKKYSDEMAVAWKFHEKWKRQKQWPEVSRVDAVYGDLNFKGNQSKE